MGDYLTQTGAQRLANKITEVWREQGFDVNVRLERSGFDAKIGQSRYDVRSDMLNGKPRKKVA